MQTRDVLLIILAVHLIFAFVIIYFILQGRSHLRKEYIIPVVIIPIFGIFLAVGIEILHKMGRQGRKPVDMETLTLGTDIYWKTLRHSQEDTNLVPLEEAISINDFKTRRKILLDMLFDNPMKYMGVLMVALHDEDVETTHYATTTVAKVQRSFQLNIQKSAVAYNDDPDNEEILDAYIGILDEYIQSGLLENYLLRKQRVTFGKLLEKKLTLKPYDQRAIIQKLRNDLALKDYIPALEACQTLRRHWPQDEISWIESLRTCVEAGDGSKLQKILKEISQNDIEWTRSGQEQVGLWMRMPALKT